ncbi:MAG TPA: hypothetical protein VG916_08215 [Gemmatimonadaceae bacterium]|nr:hypothetical protein [Gemmatimonadaceae bacterium]
MTVYANRAEFLIDRAGVVRWTHVESANGNRRANVEILAAVAAMG